MSRRGYDDHGSGPTPEQFAGSCRNKFRFRSKRQANGWRRVLVQKHDGDVDRLGVYRCRACHAWHVGSSERHRTQKKKYVRPLARAPALVARLVAAIAWFADNGEHPAGQPGERRQTMNKGEAPRTGSNGAGSREQSAVLEVLPAGPIIGADPRTLSELAQQVRIAREYPRHVKQSLQLAEELALVDDDTAASCYYSLSRKDRDTGDDKPIEGPSVRLAEIFVYAWGHLFVASEQSGLTDRFVKCRGGVWDMQTNNKFLFETTRRITTRAGRTYSDDMIATTSNAASSIAIRNGVFKVIPSPCWRPVYLKCREMSMGPESEIQKNWQKALVYFQSEWKVTEAHVLAWLGIRQARDVQRVHIGRLRGLVTAIREGDTTIEEAFEGLQIVTMPQRESATPPASGNGHATPAPEPAPERDDLYIVKLTKKETSAKPAANGRPATAAQPYWIVEFSDKQQAVTFSTTWGAQLEEWKLAGQVLEGIATHKNGDWTYLDDVKPVAVHS